MDRRSFVAGSGCAVASLAAPTIVRAATLGADAPSNRINVGFIGTGRQAFGANLPQMMAVPGVQVVAVCDADSWRMGEAQAFVNAFYVKRDGAGSYRGCRKVADFREMIADRDIDALMISTPDHWHVPMGIMAAKAKKHFALEKPISLSVRQGRMLADAVKRYGVTARNDSEFRSIRVQNHAAELIRNGTSARSTGSRLCFRLTLHRWMRSRICRRRRSSTTICGWGQRQRCLTRRSACTT
jgi:myo-inositol 2-dehydrogenase / D-chiro-inositol 1-dehydrogenase